MSTVNDTDLLAVERDGTQYQVPYSDMSTLNDTDLLVIEREGTKYKVEAQYISTGGGGDVSGTTEVEFLVIGGGGSSNGFGKQAMSGGGAGGYLSSVEGEQSGGNTAALPKSSIKLGYSYFVQVGASDSNTIFNGPLSYDPSEVTINLVALAGGIGSTDGGSGGGAFGTVSGSGATKEPGQGTAGQGFSGGDAFYPSPGCHEEKNGCQGSICLGVTYAGGGGGAGGNASNRDGGNGLQSSITGTATYYAGGGAGQYSCSGTLGTSGLGQDNFGGGGIQGGPGNDGAVILRYSYHYVFENRTGGLIYSTAEVGNSKVTIISGGIGQFAILPDPNNPPPFTVEFLVIGGGGSQSGDTQFGYAGGGAGGYISSVLGERSGGNTDPVASLEPASDSEYQVTIGAAGSNTVFGVHTALAGGGAYGGDGGSGAGGRPSTRHGQHAPGSGTTGQGFAGDTGDESAPVCWDPGRDYYCTDPTCKANAHPGAGGGAGGSPTPSIYTLDGGVGIQSSITGTPTYYAGGGAAGKFCNDGGGVAGLGADNYGGGGSFNENAKDGAVILRYPATHVIENPDSGLTIDTVKVGLNNVSTISAGTGTIRFTQP